MTLAIEADVLRHFETETDETDYKRAINSILREKMEEALSKKAAEIKKIRYELLNDPSFLQELKEKLAA